MSTKINKDNMSVTSAAAALGASSTAGEGNQVGAMNMGLPGLLGGNNMNLAALLAKKARAKKRKNRGASSVFRTSALGEVSGAVGGDNGRLDTIESRLDALEGGTEGDVTQPSPTVDVPLSPEEGVGAAPALPEPTMSAAEKMFGGGIVRQVAAGAGKFKK